MSAIRALLKVWLPWLLAFLLLIFSAQRVGSIRANAFDRYPLPGDNLWRNNATQSLLFARNWYADGLLASGFQMRFRLPSVERPSVGFPYLSYPPGFALATWGLARLSGRAPELRDVNRLGALSHYLCAFLLLVLVALVCQGLGVARWTSVSLGTLVAMTTLYIPAALIFFPYAWWADIIVLPVYLGMLIFEFIAPEHRPSRFFRALQALLLFVGVFCDWLFFLLVAAMILKDLTAVPRRRRFELFVLPGFYLLFHAWLILASGFLGSFWMKVAERTGLSAAELSFRAGSMQWLRAVEDGLGGGGAVSLYLATLFGTPLLAALFLRRNRLGLATRRWVEVSFLAIVPAELHSILLHQHYYNHVYNAVKFALLIPLFWLGLVPPLLIRRLRKSLPLLPLSATLTRGISVLAQLTVVALLGALVWLHIKTNEWRRQTLLMNPSSISRALQERCHSVYLNALPDEVAFSPDFGTQDPLKLYPEKARLGEVSDWGASPCNRNVFLVSRPEDLRRLYVIQNWEFLLAGVPFHLRLWTVGNPDARWRGWLDLDSTKRYGELQVHEISPKALSPAEAATQAPWSK